MFLVASIGLRVGMVKSVSIQSQKDAETNKNLGGVTSVSFPTAIPAVKSHSAFVQIEKPLLVIVAAPLVYPDYFVVKCV